MSTHKCEVIEVNLEPHPNADSLSIVKAFGYTVVVRTADWEIEWTMFPPQPRLGVYIPPDSVVPADERFLWLQNSQGTGRVKVRRFRGVYSQGLLMPAPIEAVVGQDFMEEWGIIHYEPKLKICTDGNEVAGPPGLVTPVYDVENFNRYGHCIPEGTPVYITEKIHGCNARYCYQDGQMYCGSRRHWKEYHDKNVWWQALVQNPAVRMWCENHPGYILYGEVFGQVQDLKYGAKSGQLFFRAFDYLEDGRWAPLESLQEYVPFNLLVPLLYEGPLNEEVARVLAEGDSVIPGTEHCREGVVICTIKEGTAPEIGRTQLKIVSNRYLERSKG